MLNLSYGLQVHFSSKGWCRFFPFAYLLFYSQVGHSLTISLPLSCPQIVTAHIMTSRKRHFVERLSEKKADSNYYFIIDIDFFVSLNIFFLLCIHMTVIIYKSKPLLKRITFSFIHSFIQLLGQPVHPTALHTPSITIVSQKSSNGDNKVVVRVCLFFT